MARIRWEGLGGKNKIRSISWEGLGGKDQVGRIG